MDQKFQTEIDKCLKEVRDSLQRQRDRYEDIEKDIPKPYWY